MLRDLLVYADASGASVGRYRDARGLEVDAVIEWPDGSWGAIEIKLDSAREDSGAETLLRLARLVRSQHGGPAVFLAVITGTGFARKRADGVFAVPIGTLGP